MAEYNGVITAKYDNGIREKIVWEDVGFIDVFPILSSEREVKVFEADKTNIFYFPDDVNDFTTIGQKQVMEYNGHFTWGEGYVEPRQHPLEITWRKPLRK